MKISFYVRCVFFWGEKELNYKMSHKAVISQGEGKR